MTSKDGSVSQKVDNGLAIWNASGTDGPGVISETMSYAMILAALYDDQATFDQLSATVQAGIKIGSNGLFPWYWHEKTKDCMSDCTYFSADPNSNSASDADINIALAYVYAHNAVTVYKWKNPPTMTYKMMASNYVKAIRQFDFSKDDTPKNNQYVLADGWVQAKPMGGGFSGPQNYWHPDYSDIRAYQLFQAYEDPKDKPSIEFWTTAIDITISCWKAIFKFDKNDKRTENAIPNPGPDYYVLDPASYYVLLSNPTYQYLEANNVYSKVKARRGNVKDIDSILYYTADSQRLPIRLLNYINAIKINSNDDVIGIACANLDALSKAFKTDKHLADRVKITDLSTGPYIQNRTAAGLLAYGSNPKLMGLGCFDQNAYNQINKGFGTNGINGDGSILLHLDGDDGFDISLTLWALTVASKIAPPLQTSILLLPGRTNPPGRANPRER